MNGLGVLNTYLAKCYLNVDKSFINMSRDTIWYDHSCGISVIGNIISVKLGSPTSDAEVVEFKLGFIDRLRANWVFRLAIRDFTKHRSYMLSEKTKSSHNKDTKTVLTYLDMLS